MQIYCVSDVHTDYSANLQWQAPAHAPYAPNRHILQVAVLHPRRLFCAAACTSAKGHGKPSCCAIS